MVSSLSTRPSSSSCSSSSSSSFPPSSTSISSPSASIPILFPRRSSKEEAKLRPHFSGHVRSGHPSFSSPSFRLFSSPLLAIVAVPFFLLFAMTHADSTLFPAQNEWEEHRICGRLLINALKTVCNHQYAQPTREQLYDNYYKSTGMLFRARRGSSSTAALIGGSGASRKRRGIIWECCTNKCSLNYIRNNYCAANSAATVGEEADVIGGTEPVPIRTWQFVEEVSKKRRRRR